LHKYVLCSALTVQCMVFGWWSPAVVQAYWVGCSGKRWMFVQNFTVTRSSVLKEAEGTNMTLLLAYHMKVWTAKNCTKLCVLYCFICYKKLSPRKLYNWI